MALEKKLVRLRKKEGMSQADVSEKLDVSRQAVSRWEAGDSRPSTENLQALCRLYNVKLDDLLSDEEISIGKTESIKTECEPEQKSKERNRIWIKRGVIAAVILALIVCCIFWYMDQKKEIELHTINGEKIDLLIDYGTIRNQIGLDKTIKLNKDNGKYVNLYVENKGSGSVIATINDQSSRTFKKGESGHIYVEVTQGALGGDKSYNFKVVTGTNGGMVDIYYKIAQRDSQ